MLIIPSLLLLSMGTPKPTVSIKRAADHISDAATVSLKYGGLMHSPEADVNVGIAVEVDTSIGIRYEVTFDLGMSSHIALFYKFSNPHQLIHYNYLTHKTSVIKTGGSSKKEDLLEVGTDVIKNYSCTHLHHENENETQDYWMSHSVPGIAQIARGLNNIDPSFKIMAIDETLFKYGGLVQLKMKSVMNKGQVATFNLYLNSAQAGIPINLADFDPPSN